MKSKEHLLETIIMMVAEEAMRTLNVGEDLARVLADEIATRFSHELGGAFLYFPKGRVFNTSKLHRQIWNEFTGANHNDLAKKYNINVISIYRILKRQAERERNERQATIPGLEPLP